MMFHRFPPEVLAAARAARELVIERRRAVGGKQGPELGAAFIALGEASKALEAIPLDVLEDAEAGRLARRFADEHECLNVAGAVRLRSWADSDGKGPP